MLYDLSWRTPSPMYAWSQDYAALLDAMTGGAVLGVVLYDTFRDGTKLFDSCLFLRRPISYKHVEFVASGRGIEYFSARGDAEFLGLCAKYEVSFLDPRSDKAIRAALQKAVDDYGKPGGPWNVPSEPGTWLQMAKDALGGELMDCSDNRGDTALARRLYLHLQSGGNITAGDMGRMVEALERRDAALESIRRHADAPDTAPPLRISVSMARETKEKVGDA